MKEKWQILKAPLIGSISILLILIAIPFVVPLVDPWNRVNCEEQEMDLVWARKRITRYLYWLPMSREIEDTALSRELNSGWSGISVKPKWRLVNTFGPYVKHSPHHRYHAAFSQMLKLELIWRDFDLNSEERQATAADLARCWQTEWSDRLIDEYFERLVAELEITHGMPADLVPLHE